VDGLLRPSARRSSASRAADVLFAGRRLRA
jgi:hypothetical protein